MAMSASGPGRSPTRRTYLQGAALIGVAAAACQPLGRPAPAAPQAVSFPAEMTWMPWSAANEWLAPTYQQVADAFSQHHPGTKLTILAVPTDWLVKLKTMIAAGTPPDVSDVHHNGQVRDLGTSGQVMDLTPFLKRDPYPKSYMGWEPWAWLKKQYGIPWALQSTAIFYNKQLFDAAGARYPTDTWTWDDFVEAAKRLTKPGADDNSTIWGAGDQGGTNYQWINALLVAFGGGVLSSDYTECTLTSSASLAGLEFRAGWGSKLRITRNVAGGTSGQFTSGNFAMVTSGSWFVANVKQSSQSRLVTSNIPWDVAPVPKGKARRAALAYELGVGIPSGVRSPDASWAVIRYLTSTEALVPFARIGRILPPDRGLWNETIPTDGQPAGFKHAFLDFWDEINIVPPFVPRWPDVDAMWQDELNAVWTGDRPPKDGATAFKTRMDQHLAQLKRDGLL
jgi:multiple sugar transport system substrate-binding protein